MIAGCEGSLPDMSVVVGPWTDEGIWRRDSIMGNEGGKMWTYVFEGSVAFWTGKASALGVRAPVPKERVVGVYVWKHIDRNVVSK